MPVIEFCDVHKTYGRPGRAPEALSGVSFAIEAGELALLVGGSGAGGGGAGSAAHQQQLV